MAERAKPVARPAVPGPAGKGRDISFVGVRAQTDRLRAELERRIAAVFDHGQFILGPEVAELEGQLARFAGARHALAVSNGTDALLMALMAEGIGPGDAVFVPAFTFAATAEVAVLAGATPVFVDVEEGSYNLDPAALRKKAGAVADSGTLRARAVIPVDLFGLPADYDAIAAVARDFDMFVIADAAQSFGAARAGRRVGALAPVTAVSFYPTKPLSACGDGGAIFTDDDERARRLESIRVHGHGRHAYEWVRVGLNGRLDTIQAAILLAKLPLLEGEIAVRERLAGLYDAKLGGHVTLPPRTIGARSAWPHYSILTPERDKLARGLKDRGIPSAVYYPLPLHLHPAYERFGDGPGSLPVSEHLSNRILSLPFHAYMEDADVDAVCAAVREILG